MNGDIEGFELNDEQLAMVMGGCCGKGGSGKGSYSKKGDNVTIIINIIVFNGVLINDVSNSSISGIAVAQEN